jgi:hypothetical protein
MGSPLSACSLKSSNRSILAVAFHRPPTPSLNQDLHFVKLSKIQRRAIAIRWNTD